jgi:hypothetical protein
MHLSGLLLASEYLQLHNYGHSVQKTKIQILRFSARLAVFYILLRETKAEQGRQKFT